MGKSLLLFEFVKKLYSWDALRGTEGSKRGAEGSKRAVKKEEDHAQCDVKKDIPYPKNS